MRRKFFILFGAILGIFSDQSFKKYATENFLIYSDSIDTSIYQGQRRAIASLQQGGLPGASIGESTEYILFQWTYVRNHGASWGAMSTLPETIRLPILHVLTLLFAFALMRFSNNANSSLKNRSNIPICLMISGATGNVIDRVARGYVTDFWDLRWNIFGVRGALPAFNLADTFVVLGLVLLLFAILPIHLYRKNTP